MRWCWVNFHCRGVLLILGWSSAAMVLGKLPVPGRPTIWMIVGQWPITLAVGAEGFFSDSFTLLYLFSPLSPSLWETARYRLKYCLKGPLNPNNQPTKILLIWMSKARAYCGCSRCGCGLFGHFFSRLFWRRPDID